MEITSLRRKSMIEFFKSFFTKSYKREPIKITLSELSSIWLKYNRSFEPQKMDELWNEEPEQRVSPVLSKTVHSEVVSDLIEPFRQIFQEQNALEGIMEALNLLDLYGGCPSVVMKDTDDEELHSLKGILSKITLRDHSIAVARIMVSLLKETYRDYEGLVPKGTACALLHDVGKMPHLRQRGTYVKADHPVIGAEILKEIFGPYCPAWLDSAADAVRNHHRYTTDQFTKILKMADARAREMEVSQAGGFLTKSWDEWFSAGELIEIIKPHVNVIQADRTWKAFSHGGFVYCQPDALYEGARELARAKGIVDLSLMRASEKEEVLMRIVNTLRKEEMLSEGISEGRIGAYFELKGQKGSKKMFLIPIKIEAFGMPSELEKLKEGILDTIKDVVPASRR